MRTRVYDQVAGTVAFEELEGSSVRVDNTVDNGEVNLMENQQERVMEDTSNLMFEQIRRAQGLTVNDVHPAFPEAPASASRRGEAAAEKRKKEEESSDDDEDLSPMERALMWSKQETPKKKKLKKDREAESPVTPGCGFSADVPLSADKGTTHLLSEVLAEMHTLKGAETIGDIKLETLTSLLGRMVTKKNGLTKKAVKDKGGDTVQVLEAIQKAKASLQAIIDASKAIQTFAKKRTRKNAVLASEKLHAMRSAGITAEETPGCIMAYGVYTTVFIAACDQKWDICLLECAPAALEKHLGSGNAEEELIQKEGGMFFLMEFIRWQSQAKVTASIGRSRLHDVCAELRRHSHPAQTRCVAAIAQVMHASDSSPLEIMQARKHALTF